MQFGLYDDAFKYYQHVKEKNPENLTKKLENIQNPLVLPKQFPIFSNCKLKIHQYSEKIFQKFSLASNDLKRANAAVQDCKDIDEFQKSHHQNLEITLNKSIVCLRQYYNNYVKMARTFKQIFLLGECEKDKTINKMLENLINESTIMCFQNESEEFNQKIEIRELVPRTDTDNNLFHSNFQHPKRWCLFSIEKVKELSHKLFNARNFGSLILGLCNYGYKLETKLKSMLAQEKSENLFGNDDIQLLGCKSMDAFSKLSGWGRKHA